MNKTKVKMKSIMNIIFFVMTSILMGSCEDKNGPGKITEEVVKVHTIYELNKEEEKLDSHAGDEASSVLEMDFNSYMVVPSATLGVSTPIYSRVKKKKNGGYLLMYQNAQIAASIYYSHSSDLKTWSNGQLLFEEKPITSPLGVDLRRYSSADATVLSNGDIIAVVAFRANKAYKSSPEYNGIMMRRSKDNGYTWGPEQVIYTGTNWEPYLLELPSGQLQCYFTDTDPVYRNSGTSMVVSNDGGNTWSPTGVGNCYKVIRQYKYMNQGKRVYTDQMPCIRLLNDGETLAGFMEARLEDNGPTDENSYYMLSLVYAKNDWQYLTGDNVGPADRQTNLLKGAAGYLAQFRSGETVISCNLNNLLSMKVGDSKARKFNHKSWSTEWFQPFTGTGYWGSIEIDGTHSLIGTMHKSGGIMIGRFILNHRITAPVKDIIVDGNINDWTHTDALFIGSESQTQTVFRAAMDAKNMYLLVERRDSYVATGDNVDLYIHNNTTNSLNENSLKITIDPAGLVACSKWSGNDWISTETTCFNVVNKVSGIMNDGSADNGYLSEISIPLSIINVNGNNIRFNAVMTDGKKTDTFTFAEISKPETWMLVRKGSVK